MTLRGDPEPGSTFYLLGAFELGAVAAVFHFGQLKAPSDQAIEPHIMWVPPRTLRR